MKNDVLGTGIPVNKNDLKDVLKSTKEGSDFDPLQENNNRSFTAAELWYMQKRQRTTTSMRRRII